MWATFSQMASAAAWRKSANALARQAGPMAWLIACGVVLTAAIGFGTVMTAQKFRENAIEAGKEELAGAALLLARHFDQQLADFEVLQTQIVDILESREISSPSIFRSEIGTFTVHQELKAKTNGWTDVAGVNVFDSDGILINSSASWPVRNLSIADRSYFQRLKRDRSLSLAIEAVSSRFSAATAIVFAKRISGPNDEFLGVVVRAVAPASFESFFASANLGPEASIALHHRDGALLARYPDADALIGHNFRNGPAKQQAVFEETSFSGRMQSPVDGEDRLIASRMLTRYPLVVVATKTVSSTLAAWRSQTKFFVAAAAASMLVVAITLGLIFRQIARQLSVDKQRLDTAIDNMDQGLLLFDSSARLIVCNSKYIEMYGLSPEIVKPGCSLRDLLRHRRATGSFEGDFDAYCKRVLAELGSVSSRVIEGPNGRLIEVTNAPVPAGGWVATHEDVTERLRAEEKIAHLAHYDSLTDLPNRVLFRGYVERKLADLAQGSKFAVLYIDVDEFKSVNDSLGHHVGDELLRSLAAGLRSCIGPGDMVARLGGDEFAIVKADIADAAEAAALAEKVYRAIRSPFSCMGQEISTDASIGIAVAPDDSSTLEQLLRNADLAMYAAKASGRRSYRFFVPEMDVSVRARRKLEQDFRQALASHNFEIHYQPLVDLSRNVVTGCEALLRWRHPERGMISPAEFIPLAEETGLINELGEWVLRRACADAASWPGELKIAVNVSPVQFKSQTLAMKVAAALADSGLSPRRLELEITEAVLISNDEEALTVLNQLRELGVGIALDDFGTGYSSLSYLHRFPFDKIKIDRSFVSDIAESGGSSPIVRAVVGMAAARSMTTTAEGVETEAQREILRELGCSQMQGYLFSPAVPADKLVSLLFAKASEAVA